MNAMVERVARVICAQWGERDQAFIDKRWHLSIPTALAVLEAMREPTEAMCEAGHESGNWGPGAAMATDKLHDADPLPCWQAMIDAALKTS